MLRILGVEKIPKLKKIVLQWKLSITHILNTAFSIFPFSLKRLIIITP